MTLKLIHRQAGSWFQVCKTCNGDHLAVLVFWVIFWRVKKAGVGNGLRGRKGRK